MAEPRFRVGDPVRVRRGVTDPDYPDLPLGGWAGDVADIDTSGEAPLYLVEWTLAMIDEIPEVYWTRCERDGLDEAGTYLLEEDLVIDDGSPLDIEQPKKLNPRPLDLDEPEERALSVLGLTSDDDLPAITIEALGRYQKYLNETLKFPFPAGLDLGEAKIGSGLRPVMVLRVLPAAQSLPVVGLMAEVAIEESRIEVPLAVLMPTPDDPSTEELTAYCAWIGDNLPERPDTRLPTHPFVLIGILTALLGGVIGAAVAVVPGGSLAAMLGAGLVAIIGFFVGMSLETAFRQGNRLPPGFFGGALLGFLGGASVGAAIGAAAVAFYASVPGAILGTMLGWLLDRLRFRVPGPIVMTFIGAGVGTVVAGLLYGWSEALIGIGWGLLGGAVGGALLIGGAMTYLSVVFYQDERG